MANSSGGNGGKSPLAQLGTFKGKAIVALVLVAVLLVVSIAGSIASLIGMLVASEDEAEDGQLYTETRLYVRALQGKWDDNAKHAMEKGKKNVPIEQLKVQLKPEAATRPDGSKLKDDRSLIDFDPTDSEGYSYITLDSSGAGVLTMGTGNDAYYGMQNGRPTKHYTLLGKGRYTFYDSYSYLDADDTAYGHTYNLNNSKPAYVGFAGLKEGHVSKEKNSASDSWHVMGLMPGSNLAGQSNYKAAMARKKSSHPALLYAYSPNGFSYGTGIGIDTGYGKASQLADLYLPYNKYYGKYGISHHASDDTGGKRRGPNNVNGVQGAPYSQTIYKYFKSLGVDPKKAYEQTWDKNVNELYELDDSGDKIGGKPRGQALKKMMEKDQAWPTTMTGGKVKQDAKTDDDKMNDYYFLACKLTDEGAKKYGSGKYHNWYGEHTADHRLSKIEACSRSDPYVVKCGNGATGEWTLLFWTEVVTVGAEGGSLNGDFSDWNKVDNKNFCSNRGGGGINPYMVRHGKPGNKHCNALPNCVAYAWGILKQHGVTLGHYGNPDQWMAGAKADGFATSTNPNAPKVGAVAVFPNHVAVVAAIEDSSHCTLIESDYSSGPSAKAYPYCRVQIHWKNGGHINGGFYGYIYTGK